MPAIPGLLASPVRVEDFDGHLSPNVREADPGFPAGGHLLEEDAGTGPLVSAAPVSVLSASRPGVGIALSQSGFDHFYFRIIIEPASFELGNVVGTQAGQVLFWNGFLDAVALQAFTAENAEGISVVQPVLPPADFFPLQELLYQFTFTAEGPPTIAATFTWTIDGEEYVLPVNGTRVVMWPFAPNWASPVRESLQWLTRLSRSYDGTEQRASLRAEARRRLSYDFLVAREESQRFDNVTWGWQNRPFAVPIWQYKCRTTAVASVGALTVSVVTEGAGFAPDNLAMFFSGAETSEVVEIDTVGPTSVTLKRALQLNWPAGTAFYPVAVANVEGNIAAQRLTDDKIAGSVRFLAHPGVVSPFTPEAAADVTYNGYEVLLRKPNWAGGLSADREYVFDVIDKQTGRMARMITDGTPMQYRQYQWLLKSRAEALSFREWLQRRQGRRHAVYVPTWHDDFTLLSSISAGASVLTVKDFGFSRFVGIDPARGHLFIGTTDGAQYFRPIAGVTQGAGTVDINFSDPLGVGYTAAEVRYLQLLPLWRLASDDIEIEWRTDTVATVSAVLQVVKA